MAAASCSSSDLEEERISPPSGVPSISPQEEEELPTAGPSTSEVRSPLVGLTMKQALERLDKLEKDNFYLRHRIYITEETMHIIRGIDWKEDPAKTIIDLKELRDPKFLQLDSTASISEAFGLNATSACVEQHTHEELEKLQKHVETLEAQILQLECILKEERVHSKQVEADLQEAQQESERMKVRCQGLELEIKQRDSKLEHLVLELEHKGQILADCNLIIRTLEESAQAQVQSGSGMPGRVEEAVQTTGITDQDAVINYLQKTVRSSQTEVEMLKEKCEKYERSAEAVQEERENLKTEMEKLQYNLMSREKVAANQEEIINILQDSVNVAQKEQKDLQQKLKDAEAGIEKLLNTLQEERKKIKDLQGQLEKFEVNFQCAMEDGKKYQDMILEAANREVRLQKEFTEKERQVLEKLKSSQTEELRMCDVVDILNTELLNIKTEFAEREAQLQSVACQNHLSTHTIEKLQKDLEFKDETIDCLQDNMNEMNLNLLTTVKMLKGKEQLVQNLQSQISDLQRQLESEEEMEAAHVCDSCCSSGADSSCNCESRVCRTTTRLL